MPIAATLWAPTLVLALLVGPGTDFRAKMWTSAPTVPTIALHLRLATTTVVPSRAPATMAILATV